MANISPYITAFSEAVYGEEVRGAMIDLANAVNNEVESNTSNVSNYTSNINNKMADLQTSQNEVMAAQTQCNAINNQAIASASTAVDAKNTAITSGTKSQSYAVGGTNSRAGEDLDNAKYYNESAKASATECNQALEQANEVLEHARAEVAGYSFWIETDERKKDAGYLYVDTSATGNRFGIDTDGFLYVEVI